MQGTLVRNADYATRVWIGLTNLANGQTLELGPGEEAETDLPDDFNDPYLKPVGAVSAWAPRKPHATKKSKARKSVPAASVAPSNPAPAPAPEPPGDVEPPASDKEN
jgi:hypothetical protein